MNQSSEATISKYIKAKSNYDKYPYIKVSDQGSDCLIGWQKISEAILNLLPMEEKSKSIIVVETYPGVDFVEVRSALSNTLKPSLTIQTDQLFRSEKEITEVVKPILGDHPIFGKMNNLSFTDFFADRKLALAIEKYQHLKQGIVLIIGPGATAVCPDPSLLIYADLARWEIQQRMRRHKVDNLGLNNRLQSATSLYKQAYFIDWRVADKQKINTLRHSDFLLDTNDRDNPKMISYQDYEKGLQKAITQPFRVVPFFDPGVWGGQWMKEICDLPPEEVNYAWCFDCVPEENSLLLGFGDVRIEIPALNLVLTYPEALLGRRIYEKFGAEFPIRFDFLDTMDGGNLSLQVHPLNEYIKKEFGLEYTQDESYYMLDVEPDAVVYLGLKENIDQQKMKEDLIAAEKGDFHFEADQYVNKFPVKKHDHILIPAGTIHCSGKNSMVLEISATPYIFTFKLWDWGRVDLNGQPRTISLEHGFKNIQWDRDTLWTKEQLINRIEIVAKGDGWKEEKTGLHEWEFIETRRHWFSQKVTHHTEGNLNVLNLIEGREVIVESPDQKFEPFIVHYAETFIVPANVDTYTITPHGESSGKQCATIKAFVR